MTRWWHWLLLGFLIGTAVYLAGHVLAALTGMAPTEWFGLGAIGLGLLLIGLLAWPISLHDPLADRDLEGHIRGLRADGAQDARIRADWAFNRAEATQETYQ